MDSLVQASCPHRLVLGGQLFSAKTVYQWASVALEDRAKAAGFVVMLEGTLGALSIAVNCRPALTLNAAGTACRPRHWVRLRQQSDRETGS
jgi:hypothetical protein